METQFSDDEDLDCFFRKVSNSLSYYLGYDKTKADALCLEYINKFQDENYCRELEIPSQGAEFFYHESATGMALRVHYYLGLAADPDPKKFIEWRSTCGI